MKDILKMALALAIAQVAINQAKKIPAVGQFLG